MNEKSVRIRILMAASDLFYRQGYTATGINQIIEEAEIAKASLYQHFRTKEELLLEYLKITAQGANEGLQGVISRHHNPKKKVASVFDFLIDFSKNANYGGCNFLNILSEIPTKDIKIRKQVKAQKDRMREMFRDILRPTGKMSLADDMYLLSEGALVSTKVQGDIWPLVRAKRMALQLMA